MSRTSKIFKYRLEITDEPQHLFIPEPGMYCMVGNQAGQLCLWVQVDPDPDRPKEEHIFRVRGTGHEIKDREDYVGSAIMDPFVWHVFHQLPDLEEIEK